jgi:exopolysaccharide biosynthesis protein
MTRSHRSTPPARLLVLLLCFTALLCTLHSGTPASGDTTTIIKVGQGVTYKKFHYNSLFGAAQDVYILDVNLNDPEVVLRFPYRTGSGTARTTTFSAETPRSVGAVNGTFFDSAGPSSFFKSNGTIVGHTKPQVHDQQAIVETLNGPMGRAGISVIPRPGAGWQSLSAPNVCSAGPDLINGGTPQTYPNHSFYMGRTARTAAAWTTDNRFLLMVVDFSSTSAGMNLPEVSQTLRNYASINNAFNLDGGGSSTMVAGGVLRNRPKDGSERPVKNAVVVTSAAAIPNRVGIARTPSGNGYWVASSEGYVFCFGDATYFGSMGGQSLNQPIVGIAARPQGDGYWLVASDGGIFCFGNAPFRGSMGGQPLNQPMVGIASNADGSGYWTVAKDGGVFSFGAPFRGSAGGLGITNVIGMVATSSDHYWLYASDGGIFSYGAPFHGSLGGSGVSDVVGMAARSNAAGYYLVRSNGAVYTYGSVTYQGGANEPGNFIEMAGGPSTSNGYFLLKKDGAIYTYGDAGFYGGANY